MKRTISHRTLTLLAFLAVTIALAIPAAPSAAAADDAAQQTRRIELPTLSTAQSFPYTIAIPETWEPRREIPAPGIFLGPPGAQPDSDYSMVFVRRSTVDLSDPQKVVEAIEANDPQQPWTAEELKVIDANGRKGVWILMKIPGDAKQPARRTLTVKLPIDGGSIDVMATAPVDDFDALRPGFEKILRSIRPDGAGEEGPGAAGSANEG